MVLTANGKRVGRPRNPPEPKKPQEYERPEYAGRLQVIVDALEIGDLAEEVRLHLQKMLRRSDLLRSIDLKFSVAGEEKVTVLLRTVFESANGAAGLTLPILSAVSDCMRSVWVDKGLAWIEAFDHIDLVALHATLSDLGIADQFGRSVYNKLTDILGPPVPAVTKPKATPAKKSPVTTRKRSRPRQGAAIMRKAA